MQRVFSSIARHRDKLRCLHTDAYNYFRNVLGDRGVLTSSDVLSSVNQDWTGNFKGNATTVLAPASTAEVSQVLAYCNQQRLSVVPMGGNTGLTGGAVPGVGEIVLSLARMNKVIDFQEVRVAIASEVPQTS